MLTVRVTGDFRLFSRLTARRLTSRKFWRGRPIRVFGGRALQYRFCSVTRATPLFAGMLRKIAIGVGSLRKSE